MLKSCHSQEMAKKEEKIDKVTAIKENTKKGVQKRPKSNFSA